MEKLRKGADILSYPAAVVGWLLLLFYHNRFEVTIPSYLPDAIDARTAVYALGERVMFTFEGHLIALGWLYMFYLGMLYMEDRKGIEFVFSKAIGQFVHNMMFIGMMYVIWVI